MAIRASDQVTLQVLATPSYIRTYYLLQSSTLTPPAAPTTNPPAAPWSLTEPGYTAGSTSTLYTVQLSVWGNGAFEYGPVQKSSAYEAAKQAYNAAQAAADAANQAAADAATAKTTADGKSRIILSSTTPTDAPDQLKQGDLWYILDVTTGGLSGINIWNGSQWAPYRLVVDDLVVPGSVGTVSIAEGAVKAPQIGANSITADKFVVGVLDGQELHGNYIEAPIIASSENLGTGANALADPEFTSQVDTAWVMSGHTGDADFVQRDNITWDKSGSNGPAGGTWRARGNVPTDLRFEPMPRTTGDALANHRSAIVNGATRAINLSSQVVDDPTYIGTSWTLPGAAGVAPTAAAQSKTTYLTNSQTVPVAAGETWNVSVDHAGLNADTAVFVQAWVQVVNAATSAVIWEREIGTGELASNSPVSASFVAPSSATMKFRIKATYTAAGGGLKRTAQAGSYVRRENTNSILADYNDNVTGRTVDPVSGLGYLNTSYGWNQDPRTKAIWDKARTRWRITRAVFAKVAPEKGYRIDRDGGFQLFNASGAQTGRLDGQDNFLAGTFATAESGRRVQMDNQRVAWFDQFGVLTTELTAADVIAVKDRDSGWLPLSGTAANGFYQSPTAPVGYRRIGSAVYLRGDFYRSTSPGNTVALGAWNGALPEGFRPASTVGVTAVRFWDLYIEIPPAGDIRISANLARTSGVGYATNGISFLVD